MDWSQALPNGDIGQGITISPLHSWPKRRMDFDWKVVSFRVFFYLDARLRRY
jgi:hypothetical protein